MIVQLWQLYHRAVDYDSKFTGKDTESKARQLLLNMLRGGLRADVLHNWGFHQNAHSIGGTPLGFLANKRTDVELFEAYIDAGHYIDPSIYDNRIPDLDRAANMPDAVYRIVKGRSAHGISIVHLLSNGAASVIYMRSIYKAYNNHVATGIPFFEALANEKLDRFWSYSPTLSKIFHKVNAGTPLFDVNLTKAVLSKSDTELEVAMIKMLFLHPGFRIEDHLALSAPDNFSPMIMAANMNRALTVKAIREHVEEQIQLHPHRRIAIVSAIRTTLEAGSKYVGRSALHCAALFHGQDSDTFKEMIQLEKLVTSDLDHLQSLVDTLGQTPFDYDKRESVVSPYDDEVRAFQDLSPGPGAFPAEFFAYEEQDSGGWA